MTTGSHVDHCDIIIVKGIVGGTVNMLGFITSFQEQLEWWFRIASLTVGLLVGVLTAISILRKMGYEKRHQRPRKDNQS